MAGHAKWQNIKVIKAEKDKQKGALCNKYVRLVTALVREHGPDPKANSKLANLLEEAKRNNIPSSTLENALKRAKSKKLQSGTIEMLGPGGSIIIFEYETDDLCEMRRMIKVMCRKYSVGIFPATSERWRAAYEQKGIIRVSKQLNGENIDDEKMLDAAIEAGAEDVKKGEEDNIYEFYSAPDDVHLVKSELEQKFVVEEAFVGYLTTSTVSIPEPDKTHAMNFLNELGDLPDTMRLYENIE
jgi:transcriptional/translational regulatory protein YebC/TACO1